MQHIKNKNAKERPQTLLLLAIACAIIGFTAIFFPYFEIDGTTLGKYKIEIGKYENFGQFVGGVTAPFFSIAAFFLLYLTYSSQREELRLNREEFREQNETLKLQRFENTFFNMLQMHSDIVDKMTIGLGKGRTIVDITKKELVTFLAKAQSDPSTVIDKEYLEFYKKFESNFNHYFRQLYHIFKFIYFSQLRKEEKNFYASIARSTLSQNELFLIAFNSVIENYGYPNFLYLIKEFDIFHNFRHQDVQPQTYWQYILHEKETVEYPFDLPKPIERNIP